MLRRGAVMFMAAALLVTACTPDGRDNTSDNGSVTPSEQAAWSEDPIAGVVDASYVCALLPPRTSKLSLASRQPESPRPSTKAEPCSGTAPTRTS